MHYLCGAAVSKLLHCDTLDSAGLIMKYIIIVFGLQTQTSDYKIALDNLKNVSAILSANERQGPNTLESENHQISHPVHQRTRLRHASPFYQFLILFTSHY